MNPTRAELATAARTAGAVLKARWVLHRGGFPGAITHYGLEPTVPPRSQPGSPVALVKSEVRAARVALRVLRLRGIGSTCLPTSLALAHVLQRRGLAPELIIGVSSREGEFSAHAWVEVGGRRIDASRLSPAAHEEIARFRLAGRSSG